MGNWYNRNMKKSSIFLIIIFLSIVILVSYFVFKNNEKEIVITPTIPIKEEPISLCYYYLEKNENGLYDKAYLRLDILGEKVIGEFNNFPAEKDSKTGNFEGTVGPLDPKIMGRTANLWWNSFAEGIQVKEELLVEFGDGSASALYGEMIDRGDGVYLYKDKKEIFFGPSLSQISCDDLDEIILVEKYLKDNINTITQTKPVLGGVWYPLSILINYTLNEGIFVYEDGHIQGEVRFQYEFNIKTKDIDIKNIEKVK